MGRPKKAKIIEEYQGRYRCTLQEKAIIFENARQSGLGLNEYIRRRLVGHTPIYSAEAMHIVALLQSIHTRLWGMKSEDMKIKYELMDEIKNIITNTAKSIGGVTQDDYYDEGSDEKVREK